MWNFRLLINYIKFLSFQKVKYWCSPQQSCGASGYLIMIFLDTCCLTPTLKCGVCAAWLPSNIFSERPTSEKKSGVLYWSKILLRKKIYPYLPKLLFPIQNLPSKHCLRVCHISHINYDLLHLRIHTVKRLL